MTAAAEAASAARPLWSRATAVAGADAGRGGVCGSGSSDFGASRSSSGSIFSESSGRRGSAELPAKAPEKVVMQAEGSGSQSGRVGGAKAKEKEKGENNGKSFSIRQSARPTANPWFRAVLYMQFYNRNFITKYVKFFYFCYNLKHIML